jgi:hypothetical protein
MPEHIHASHLPEADAESRVAEGLGMAAQTYLTYYTAHRNEYIQRGGERHTRRPHPEVETS